MGTQTHTNCAKAHHFLRASTYIFKPKPFKKWIDQFAKKKMIVPSFCWQRQTSLSITCRSGMPLLPASFSSSFSPHNFPSPLPQRSLHPFSPLACQSSGIRVKDMREDCSWRRGNDMGNGRGHTGTCQGKSRMCRGKKCIIYSITLLSPSRSLIRTPCFVKN